MHVSTSGEFQLVVQETVADELEEAYRNHIWNPALRHVKEHKPGFAAARVELTTLHTKVHIVLATAQCILGSLQRRACDVLNCIVMGVPALLGMLACAATCSCDYTLYTIMLSA